MNVVFCYGQTAWPGSSWASAVNLSAVYPSDAIGLSGMYWNSYTSRLYTIGDKGYFYVLQYNKTTNAFTLIGSNSSMNGPEGVTMVNDSVNEFYTIDENSYQIRKYTHNADFSNIILSKYWYLLQSPSPMPDTGNTGPEGICFVPDKYLNRVGFISSVSGKAYTSTKGMGGLIFIAHQDGGYVWVFDVNPKVTNDFAYVGKYKTNETESCDAAFDRSTGLLYILHNTGDNYLEVTDMTTTLVSGAYKFVPEKEFLIPNPTGSVNVEGFALSPKYPTATNMGAWLCRDVKLADNADAVRWFTTFAAEGTDIRTDAPKVIKQTDEFNVFPNPVRKEFKLTYTGNEATEYSVQMYSSLGQLVLEKNHLIFPETIQVSTLKNGFYILKISPDKGFKTLITIIKRE
jgi:hypothetical protein